jgi:hypothetical protein
MVRVFISKLVDVFIFYSILQKMLFFQKNHGKHIMSKCIDNYFFLKFLIFENMFWNNGYITYPSGAELDLQILCHSCQWHECVVHNFLHTYEIFKAKSNTSLSLHLCELFDWPTIHALLWSSLLYFLNNFSHCPRCTSLCI